jgi:decaprenylphospho-beta-D-ribofuranose 2-oxidase
LRGYFISNGHLHLLVNNNNISGWGNFPKIIGKISKASTREQLIQTLNENDTIIPFGNGRSYGDSALNDHMVQYDNPEISIEFDQELGIVQVSAATQIGDLIDYILPFGWFPPVVPGTKFVTIGGAIAADIHGKNHHVDGCFSQHIISIDLMLQNGDIVQCSHQENSDLFKATCGGMGLTGVILNATIKMIQVQSRFIEQISYKAQNIDELFSHFHRYDSKRYSVAWLDCTSKGNKLGRGVLITGEFLKNGAFSAYNRGNHSRLNIPFFLPSWLINHLSLKIFNTLYYHLSGFNERKKVVVDLNRFFFPLDQIHNWNRLYGKNGFLQYQFVLPLKNSKKGIKQILHKIASSGLGSPLAVLKLFGPKNDNYLSFPTEGYTLALDFKNQPSIFPLLDELDRIVLDLKGKIYLAKDARMTKEHFEQTYENLQTFTSLRKEYGMRKKLKSIQSQRLSL